MIRGVNQSMVNRYISGGNCKCIGGNGVSGESTDNDSNVGSNDNSISGGKIEVEFTVYRVEDNDEKGYIKKEDADKVANEILNVDLEKCEFNRIYYTYRDEDMNKSTNIYRRAIPCRYDYATNIDENTTTDNIIIFPTDGSGSNTSITTTNGTLIWNEEMSTIIGINVTENSIPDTARAIPYKCIFYYTEI